jgi:hypothetical protein
MMMRVVQGMMIVPVETVLDMLGEQSCAATV